MSLIYQEDHFPGGVHEHVDRIIPTKAEIVNWWGDSALNLGPLKGYYPNQPRCWNCNAPVGKPFMWVIRNGRPDVYCVACMDWLIQPTIREVGGKTSWAHH